MRTHPGNFATIAVGLLFVAAGIYTWFHMGETLAQAREATAVVIEVSNESAGTRKGRTHPVVRFTTDQGREVVARSLEHHNVKPADTVTLVYDARDPQSIDITTLDRAERRRLFFSGMAVALGVLVCAMGMRHLIQPRT